MCVEGEDEGEGVVGCGVKCMLGKERGVKTVCIQGRVQYVVKGVKEVWQGIQTPHVKMTLTAL